jgi:acyl-CoA thioesterase FadM
VKVRVLPEELSKTSVLLDYTVTNAAETRLVAPKLRIVFVGSNGRPVSIPQDIHAALEISPPEQQWKVIL